MRAFRCHSASMAPAKLSPTPRRGGMSRLCTETCTQTGQTLTTLLTLVTNPLDQVTTLLPPDIWPRGWSIIEHSRGHASGGALPYSIARQPISHARFGEQNLRPGGVRLDLMAKMPHVHAEIMGRIHVVRPPDFLEQLSMSNDLAGVLDQSG